MSRAKHHEHGDEDDDDGASPAHTRIKGLLFLIGGSAGVLIAMLVSAYLVKHGLFPRRGGIPAMVLIFVPIFIALLGFVELLTGYEIRQVTNKWYDLKTWQRGILGTLLAFSPFIFYAIGVELF